MEKFNIMKGALRRAFGIGRCTAFVLATTALLSACHDDINYPSEPQHNEGFVIYIPNVEGAAQFGTTRADDFANPNALLEAEEGEINSLWLVAIPKDSGDEPRYIRLQGEDTGDESQEVIDIKTAGTDYKSYTLSNTALEEGKTYYLYLFGNLDLPGHVYVPEATIKGLRTKAAADALVIDFQDNLSDKSSNPLVPGYLPMACTPSRMRTSMTGSELSNGEFTFEKNSSIFANLSFLCSKVRYTIFFDNSQGGFSYNGFKNTSLDFYTSDDSGKYPTARQIRKQTALQEPELTSAIDFITDTWKVDLQRVHYPGDGNGSNIDTYPSYKGYEQGSDEKYPVSSSTTWVEGNLPALGSANWSNEKQRAWQGVAYLPENKVTATATSDGRTSINFTAQNGSDEETYTLSLLPDNSNLSRPTRANDGEIGYGIRRSTLHDIVIKVSSSKNWSPTVYLSDWNLQTLSYSLHGPYELEVEATQISVSSGQKTTMWYRSNVAAEDIHFNIPTVEVNGNKVPFYLIDKAVDENGQTILEVRVNPNIPYSQLSNLNVAAQNLQYFEIVAGNIVKRIVVDPLNLEPSLEVTPLEITINVREYIASGDYSTTIPIEFFTNVGNLKVTAVEEGDGYDKFPMTSDQIKLVYNNILLSTDTYTFPGDPKQGFLNIVIENFNSGHPYWKSGYDYRLTFSVDKVTVNKDGTEVVMPEDKTVIIHVRPYTTDYVLHFKTTNGWSFPHIYVYQTLTLPANIPDWTNSGTTYNYSNRQGRPVGYVHDNKYFAALEYNFSSCVAFKGWRNFGNDNDDCYTDPRAPGNENYTTQQGFFIFDFSENEGHWTYGKSSSDLYYPYKNVNNTVSYRYDEMASYTTNVNFNQAHIDRIGTATCCSDGTYGKMNPFPGIIMEEEDYGWWRYTLSGVATPGKALIMFSDGHGNDDKDIWHRYPADAQVGIPLFDYPDNEGWFYFDGANNDNKDRKFTDDKPAEKNPLRTFRVYWPTGMGNGLFMGWNNLKSSEYPRGGKIANNWERSKNIGKTDSKYPGYYYYEFTAYDYNSTFQYKFSNDDSGCKEDHPNNQMSVFEPQSDGKYVAYIPDHNQESVSTIKSGYPTKNQFENGDKVRVIWYRNNGSTWYNYVHAWYTDGGGDLNGWNEKKGEGYSNEYNGGNGNMYFYDYTITGNHKSFRVMMSNDSQGNGAKMEFEVNYDDIKNNFNNAGDVKAYEWHQTNWP